MPRAISSDPPQLSYRSAMPCSPALMHPFVLGVLACGKLRNRDELLRLFQNLLQATVTSDEEVLFFIERHALTGRGIGYMDAYLLAATAPARLAQLRTRDQRSLT